jgi:hypothetical protein
VWISLSWREGDLLKVDKKSIPIRLSLSPTQMTEFTDAIFKKLQGLSSDLPSPGTFEGLHKESRGFVSFSFKSSCQLII